MQHVFDIFYSRISSDDDNRIVLKPLGDCQNDYINASYVDVRIHSLNNYWTLKITLIVYVHLYNCIICLPYRVMKVFINLSLAKVNTVITFVSRKFILHTRIWENSNFQINMHNCAVTIQSQHCNAKYTLHSTNQADICMCDAL